MRCEKAWRIQILATTAFVLAFISCSTTETATQGVFELQLEATYPDGFGLIETVRELSDGRLMAADPLGQVLIVWDVAGGTADTLGRSGSGPQEYRQPDAVHPLPGDSTLVVDLGNARLIAVGPEGVFGSSTSIMLPRPEGFPMSILPRFVDRQGRIYFYLSLSVRGQRPDSGAIARFDRRTQAIDTLGYVRLPRTEFERVGNDMVMTVGPLLPRDDWAVADDGSVAIVRAADYSVEWLRADGGVVAGPATPFKPVVVGAEERERWADEAYAGQMTMTSMVRGNGDVSQVGFARGGGSRPNIEPVEWPEHLPAFRAERARVSPDGKLWVERYVGVGEPPVIDIFDRYGNKTGETILEEGCKVVGFGETAVYIACADEFGLLWLRRFRVRR